MELIVDANILFAMFIRDGVTTDLAFEKSFQLIAPEFIIDEFIKYKKEISFKSKRSPENFIQLMHLLMKVITIIPSEEYCDFIDESLEISPDENDAMYFALALRRNSPIWSNDKKLKEQDKVKIYSTKEIMEIFCGR